MAKKKIDSMKVHMMDMDAIFGKSTEERRVADKALDRRGIPGDYKSQYVAESDMQGQANKFKREQQKRSDTRDKKRK